MTNLLARFPIPISTYLRLVLALVVVVMVAWFGDSPSSAGFNAWTTHGPSGNPGIYALAMDPNNANVIYAASRSKVYKSTDAGASWSAGNGFGADYNGLALARSNPKVVYATGGGTVYKSSDGGATWNQTNLANNFSGVAFSRHGIAVDPNNENIVYVGTTRTDNLACEVWKSTDGGATFQGTGLPVSSAISVVIAPNNPNIIYAGTFNGVVNGVYKSVNGGASWNFTNMPGHQVWALAVDPNNANVVYAGASFGDPNDGVYKTTNGGLSWSLINNGLTNPTARALAVDPSNSATVYLGTVISGPSGMFRSTDGGANWSDFRTNSQPAYVTSLIVDQTGTFIHAGSSSVYDYRYSSISGPTTFLVNNVNDSGAGSLRQAMLDANDNAGTDTIAFNIPGSGVHTISPTSVLPTITDPVVIDGATQPGFAGTPLIEVNGAGAGANTDGFIITAGGSTVRGLVINRFTRTGIVLRNVGNNIIESNYVGTNNTGTGAAGNLFHGIELAAPNNTIGGTTAGARNVISGNGNRGVFIGTSNGNNNGVQGNYIGTNAAGTAAIKNNFDGLTIEAPASNNLIGGPTSAARNVISGNDIAGLTIESNTPSGTATGNVVQGNYIGVAADGTTPLGNTAGSQLGWGVIILRLSQGNTIGGTAAGEGNVIANNAGPGVGVSVNTAINNRFLRNSIFANGGLGIDLNLDGVTANDVGDGDTGPNNLQNFPVLSGAFTSGGNTIVQGTLNSTASRAYRLEFFSNATCDASGNGEGRTFLGSTTVTTNTSGNASFIVTLNSGTTVGEVVTATATDPTNNTSEFSACRQVTLSFGISGRVVDVSARGLGGVTVTLAGAASSNTTTDVDGNFSFGNLTAGGNYTVTPSSGAYSFSPVNQTFNNLSVDRIANFTGTQTVVNIAGSVTDSNNVGLNGVTLTLTKNGTAAGTTATNSLGNYSFGNLAVGANYVVTPAGSFTPSTQTFGNLTTNTTANFKAAPSIPSQCNTVSFAAATNFVTAQGDTGSVAVGDFNGDGKLDLAVAKGNSNTVSILLGTGAGNFSSATNFAVGSFADFVAVGDFNGDNKPDLAVATFSSNTVSILLGTGTGSFGAPTSFAAGPGGTSADESVSVAVGDFNGDGKLDLTTANSGSANVSVLLGTGTGSFGAATNFAVGSFPRSVAVGDFNGDGKLDLAVSNGGSNSVSILLGTGTGNFSAATNFAAGSFADFVAVRDVNNDAKLDLVVANRNSANVSILLGTGTGSFSTANNFAAGTGPVSAAVVDFNGDGKQDLAILNFGSANVSVLLGNGAGSFSAATTFAVGPSATSIGIGDFNGDGKSDLAVAYENSNNVSILLNTSATCNTQSSLTISGRTADANNNPLSEVTVTLSGPITRVVQSDINGNYSLSNLTPGGNYAVTVQSPYFIFAPSRADFFNLSSNQTANFAAAPAAVPVPSPPLSDDFTSTVRDPTKWNLGTQTQPAAAVDPQVTTTQLNGQLVITPVNQASGMHYNGYVAANAFDIRNGKATVEIVKAATAGADTLFAIGSDSNNFFRFLVHTVGVPTSLVTVDGVEGLTAQVDPTTPQLIFQVKINGQLTSLSINYDPVVHRFMRFRHEPPAVAPTDGAIVFETSPNNVDFTVRHRVLLTKGVSPLTAELSAGTSSPTNPGQAVFDNLTLTTTTFQFSSGSYTVGEGDGSVLITVTRAGSVTDAASVDYATVDGTAQQGSKYVNATGKLTFAAGQTSKTFSVLILDNDLAEGNKTVNLMLGNPVSAGFNSPGRAVLNIVDNDTLAPIWQPVMLTAGQAEIKTWISGGRTYAYLKLLFPNAGYRVIDWGAPARAGNDFTADAAVEKFSGASVQAVTTTAQIYDLGPLANGTYNFNFKTSGTLAKTLQFTVSSTVPPPNPIDTAREFVKQQYRDFLNREADQAGENFWTDNITKCSDPARRPAGQTEAQCTLRQRETTSGAFFLSPEFQYTGYFVYRMYQGGLGRQPKLSEFIPDAQFVGNGIVVNGQLSGAKINQNKATFAALFVNCTDATKYRCAEFKTIYDSLNNTQYVDKLFLTTGVNASATDRTALVNGLNGGTETRASVLQKVVDGINVISEGNQQFTTTYGQAFYNSEFNRAFVELEYFGYMKRDPDDAGYAFWLGKLNQFGGNFVNAEMVLAFISSPEYRARFGQP